MPVREWERTTRSRGWDELPTAVPAKYAELHGRDDLLADRLACVETVSSPLRRRLVRGRKADRTGLTTDDSRR
jgi:hypothetical protein